MIRALFVLCVSLIPVYLGFLLAARERMRLSVLQGFLDLVLHVRYEIGAFLTRRRDLFLQFECAALEEIGFLSALRAAGHTAENPLYDCLSQWDLPLSLEDRRVLLEYAARLGECDATEEEARAAKVCELLGESVQRLREETRNRVRLYRAFGVVGGLALALFVW